jgi:putative oxygen-independent coproporphyrinogen III oxidase
VAGLPEFGVYVHVPFCTRRCDYCAFATWTDRFHLVDDYVKSGAGEIDRAVEEGMGAATSVFFGGGTPSLLTPSQLSTLLSSIPLQPDAEVTVECNPDTVDAAKLRGYREAGVSRLSFGVQSMVPHVLAGLGREHSADAVRGAVDAAGAAGFADAYNVDLMFGGAGETRADWEATLTAVIGLGPPPAHVSAYALTVEPGTPLARDRRRHPDPDDQADKYLMADEVLSDSGRPWYEISNWSRPGRECRHNRLYWSQGQYRGIGCAAHSHQVDPTSGGARRWWNVRTPERYISLVAAGRSPEAAGEDLDAGTRRREALELALRTRDGVPAEALPGWADDPALRDLVAVVEPSGSGRPASGRCPASGSGPASGGPGLDMGGRGPDSGGRAPDTDGRGPDPGGPGAAPGGRLVLTRAGRLLANEVAIRLVP